jgi:shikimate dehydrogenase
MAAVEQLTPAAAAIGAVNTLIVGEDGTLTGDNTDAPGFVADLRAHGVEPAGARALVLGAGGSARAIGYGLAEAGAAAVTVLNRTPARAQALAAALQPLFPQVAITAGSWPVAAELAAQATLIVNCTQLGMTPQPETTPWPETVALQPGQVVYDLVYNPPVTRLLQQAEAGGARAIGGLGMLIWQGALAFARWTGQEPPVDVMRGAAVMALHRRGVLPVPGAAVTVRRAQSADAAAISALNAQVLQLHAEARPDFFKTPSDTTFPPVLVVEWMERPELVFFVAEAEGHVIGYLMVELSELAGGASTRALKRANIHHVVVAQSARRQGAGAALLRTARMWAQDNGADLVVLEVWAFNAAAQRFFAGQGFAPFTHRLVWAGEDNL